MNAVDIFCSACFSGYRPDKFDFPLDADHISFLRLQSNIESIITNALELGYKTFLCGMEHGFDLLCADALLDIREQNKKYHNISLIAVLPYTNHSYKGKWESLHNTVKRCANQIVIISPNYSPSCYHNRNRYLIDHSSHLICYFDGKSGDTAPTIKMANKNGLTIDNIANQEKTLQRIIE